MKRPTRALAGAFATSLLVMGIVAATASAAPVHCGQAITANTTLTSNLGPCPGNGLVVRGDDITLNLNGFTVSAKNGPQETAGILLAGAHRATVKHGTVQRFDAGVNVRGGSHNTVRNLAVRDNINDNITTDNPDQDCNFGDGITTTNSDDNRIIDNAVLHNGPFAGISLVENSDRNLVSGNDVRNNNVPNEDAAPGFQGNGNCGSPFSRPIQDIGIRVEGPGDNDNRVERNRVMNSAIGGITIHGYVFNPPPPPPPPGGGPPPPPPPPDQPNTGNLVSRNYVADTGKETSMDDPLADGIGVLRQGPSDVVGVSQGNTISRNHVVRSFRHGIFLGQPTQPGPIDGNTVSLNLVEDSAADGIRLNCARDRGVPREGPSHPPCAINNTVSRNTAHGSGSHDGHDDSVDCDSNAWLQNKFDFVNQECVDFNATVGMPPPAPTASTAAK